VWVEVVASTLAGAPRSPSPHRGVPELAGAPMRTSGTRTLTHSTDRNDAPGLAYLARTGFFKPVHMKSLSAHALRSLIIVPKKTGGRASDLGESDPRFGGRVRQHHPSIPIARCAQTPVIRRRLSERAKSDPKATFRFESMNGWKTRRSGRCVAQKCRRE
jgi:hypothetical protein